MGRRSTHTHEELRELVLRSAQELIEAEGLAGLSAREIARKVGYSPGTLYNLFDSLDDLVLHLEARLLTALDQRLSEVSREGPPEDLIRVLARAYITFTHERPKLWNLLFEHQLPPNSLVPLWYQERTEGLLQHVERALAPLMPDAGDQALKRSARVLWTSVLGISYLSTARKFSGVLAEPAQMMVDEFVTSYLRGLRAQATASTEPQDP